MFLVNESDVDRHVFPAGSSIVGTLLGKPVWIDTVDTDTVVDHIKIYKIEDGDLTDIPIGSYYAKGSQK